MSKNKLQEVAQREYRSLPIYNSTKEGPDHAPRFRASVTYNGHTYHSPGFCRSVKQAEIAAAEAALHALSLKSAHNSNLTNRPVTVQMEPAEVLSTSQKESNKDQKGDRKEETLQPPEDVLPISESGMANVLVNSKLKAETSQIAQAPPLSFPSSRIHLVPLQGFSISANSGKGTEKQNTGNISSIPEISGNETNKEQTHKMAAGKVEERQWIEDVIQQSEGRISTPQFMSDIGNEENVVYYLLWCTEERMKLKTPITSEEIVLPIGSIVLQGAYLRQVKIVSSGIHFIDYEDYNKVYHYSHHVIPIGLYLPRVTQVCGHAKWKLDIKDHEKKLHVIDEHTDPVDLV